MEGGKKITITNKRIVVAANWFGVESYRGALSYFYNEYEYKLYKKPRSSLIGKYTFGKLKCFGGYIKITPGIGFVKPRFVIFNKESQRIAEIISQAI